MNSKLRIRKLALLVAGMCGIPLVIFHLKGSRVRYPVWQHTFVSPSAFSRRAVVSYWRKYVHEVLVNRLGGLSLPRKSVVRLTDRPDMTLDVYRGRKTTIQQQLELFPCTVYYDRSYMHAYVHAHVLIAYYLLCTVNCVLFTSFYVPFTLLCFLYSTYCKIVLHQCDSTRTLI